VTRAERDALITDNLPLAHAVANRFKGLVPATLTDEVESAALLGLTIAARDFDPARGVRFSTYAWPTIRGTIITALRRQTHGGKTKEFNNSFEGEVAEQYLADNRCTASGLDAAIDARARVATLKRRLPMLSRRIIEMRFHRDMTLAEIARKTCRSECGISKIIAEAIALMRRPLSACPPAVRRRVHSRETKKAA
jgi:RNA polymerase sigma factor (sigma-70 family)